MTDRHGFEGLEDIEDRLRGALSREADRVQPEDRLSDIRAAVSPSQVRRWRWVAPIAAAAAVAAVGVAVWVGLRPTTQPTPAPANPSTTAPALPSPSNAPSASSPTPSTGSGSPSSTGSSTSAPAPTVSVALPVYYVAPPGSADGHYRLVRVFVPGQLPSGATTAQKADAALAAAVTVPANNTNRFVAAWPTGTTAKYVAMTAPELGVSLSGPGVTGLPEEAQRMAVQALVWTVTAAAQQAQAPVSVVVSGGRIFESVSTNVFKRPADDRQFEEIASIWVDSPYAGQVLSAGKAVVVTGQACVFEANVTWELRQGGSVVQQGHTTATSGCPQQGSWTVNVGTLPAGQYEFRGIEVSPKDGSIAFQNIVPFTVR
jgi:Immunoglobulin-like domain of bacterial spore germination/Sporulation and spore germination